MSVPRHIRTIRGRRRVAVGAWPRAKTVTEWSIQKRHRVRTMSRTAKVISDAASSTMSVMVLISAGLGRTEKEGCECHSPR